MTTPPDCVAVQELANNGAYKCLMIFKGCVALVSIVLFALHAGRKRKQRFYHTNTRIIYWCFCLLTLWNGIHYVPLHFYDFFRLALPMDPCARLYPMPMVVYLRMATSSVMFSLDFALFVMCMERVICTLKITNYEDSACPKFIVSSLVTTILVWAGIYYAMVSPGVDFIKPVVRPTTANKQNALSGNIIIFLLLASESVSLLLFLYIRRWNRQLGKTLQRQGATSQSQKLLSMKFQVGETLRVTDVFVPILVVKWALTVLGCLAIYLQRLVPSLVHASAADQAAFFEAVNINYLQGLTTPLLLMYRCDQLGSFLRGSKVTPVEQIVATQGRTNVDDYFKRLESTFNA